MKWNVLKHEFGQHVRSSFLWIFFMLVFAGLFLGFYQNLVADTNILSEVLKGFPEGMAKLTGFSDLIFTSVIGFYGLTMIYVTLIGAIQAMNLGITIVGKETTNKTSDFILTKPITRQEVLGSKVLAGLGVILFTNILFIPIVFLMINGFIKEPPNFSAIFLTSISLPFIQIVFFSLGFLISNIIKQAKNPMGISLPLVFGFYIVGMLDELIGKEQIRYLTPFKFFDFEYIQTNNSYEFQFILIGLIVISLALYMSFKKYLKKDIPAV